MDDLTYPQVGATSGALPPGYHHLRVERGIGHGREALERAGTALLAGEVHRRAGLSFDSDVVPLREGAEVRMRLGRGPLAFRAPCRVVWAEVGEDLRGFAYGTLPGHPESGEERFEVVLDDGGEVRFVITAFSRPARWFTRLGGPAGRLVQRVVTRRYLDAAQELASP